MPDENQPQPTVDVDALLTAAEAKVKALAETVTAKDQTIAGLNAQVEDLRKKSLTDAQIARLQGLAS